MRTGAWRSDGHRSAPYRWNAGPIRSTSCCARSMSARMKARPTELFDRFQLTTATLLLLILPSAGLPADPRTCVSTVRTCTGTRRGPAQDAMAKGGGWVAGTVTVRSCQTSEAGNRAWRRSGATGRNRTCDVAFGGPHDIHFTTVARQPALYARPSSPGLTKAWPL